MIDEIENKGMIDSDGNEVEMRYRVSFSRDYESVDINVRFNEKKLKVHEINIVKVESEQGTYDPLKFFHYEDLEMLKKCLFKYIKNNYIL